MSGLEERVSNIERILLLKYGTLDYEKIEKAHAEWLAFLRDANKGIEDLAEKIEADAKEYELMSKQIEEERRKAREMLDESIKRLKEMRT